MLIGIIKGNCAIGSFANKLGLPPDLLRKLSGYAKKGIGTTPFMGTT